MRTLTGMVLCGILLSTAAGPAFAQADSWQRKWYWGAQSGVLIFKTPSAGADVAVSVGGHWLITGKRSGLFLGIDQLFFPTGTNTSVGATNVTFDSGRRLQAALLAIPSNGALQLYAGVGLAIHQITDASPRVSEDTRAFGLITAGFQMRFGTRWAFYGAYQFIPSTQNFLITSEMHAINGGLRVAISGSREEVTTER